MPRYSEPRESSQDRRLRQQATRQEISTQRQQSRNASQGAMLQQLQTLYNIGQESQMSPERMTAARLANERAQAELGFLPQQTEAALAESGARTRASEAQTDYYGLQKGRPDIGDITRLFPEGAPEAVRNEVLKRYGITSLDDEMKRKAAEHEANLAREAQIMGGGAPPTAPVALPPGVPDTGSARAGAAARDLLPSDQDILPILQGLPYNAPAEFAQGAGVPSGFVEGINQFGSNLASAPAEGILFYLQQLGVSPETLRSWGLAR